MADERRQLVAERFTAARGEHGEQLLAVENPLDQCPLQAAAVRRRRRRAEPRQAEEAPQQGVEIVGAAVRAARVAARAAAQAVEQVHRPRIPRANPARQHRAVARHLQPSHRESPGRPRHAPLTGGFRQRPDTHPAGQARRQVGACLGAGHRRQPGDGREECDQTAVVVRVPLPAATGVAIAFAFSRAAHGSARAAAEAGGIEGQPLGLARGERGQRPPLVGKQPRGQPRVGHRIARRVADKLVVLDQPVIGNLRKGQRRQHQGVDRRQREQRRALAGLAAPIPQHRQVVPEQIVTEDEGGPGAEPVQPGEGIRQGRTATPNEGPLALHRTDLQDAPVARGLEVERQTALEELLLVEAFGHLPGNVSSCVPGLHRPAASTS